MTGYIKNFVEEKGFGFIKGDNDKDYFFHQNDIDNKNKICDGALVSFEEHASPKGYAAKKVKIESNISSIKYIIPNEIYQSKSYSIKGWETIDKSSIFSISSSSRDLDSARKKLDDRARQCKVNALTNVYYSKSTGSEPGTGKGTHYYTIHNFSGIPTNIGKKNLKGRYIKEELSGIDSNITELKNKLIKDTSDHHKILYFLIAIFSIFIILGFFLSGKTNPSIFLTPIGVYLFFLFFVGFEDLSEWIEES